MPKPMSTIEIDALLAAWLRGERREDVSAQLKVSAAEILIRIEFHGIAGLLNNLLQDKVILPEELAIGLRERAIALAFWEASHARLLAKLLQAFGARGIKPLLFKGTALAYSHYANPAFRARGDTDMLVASEDYDRAGSILQECDLTKVLTAGGRIVSFESLYIFNDAMDINHEIDLHEKLSNSAVLARLFTYEELFVRAADLPELSCEAKALGPIDALLIACLHRFVHVQSPYYVNGISYHSADRLIWLEDIHLLASGFSESDWETFLRLARLKGLGEVCCDSLTSAKTALGTLLPDDILERLIMGKGQEALSRYLKASRFAQMRMNFYATPGVPRKAQFLREMAFPSEAYMRAEFSNIFPSWLPWLYIWRAFFGIWKLWPGRDYNK